MTALPVIDGIAGLTGKEPIGAVVTIGHKGPSGNPTETDRFFIVNPTAADNVRGLHPSFEAFNKATPEKRQSLRGFLVHATQEQSFEHYLKMQIYPKERAPQGIATHPNRQPVCVGNGQIARRWVGPDKDAFKDIRCPHDLCEFRQSPMPGKKVPCTPFLRFLFRPKWSDGSPLPTPLMKLTSQSWNSARSFIGFFDYLKEQARLMGVAQPSFYGLPFQMTLNRKTNPTLKTNFPVLHISPECDVQDFFYRQSQRQKEFAAQPPLAALTDASERSFDVIAADTATIQPGIPRSQS